MDRIRIEGGRVLIGSIRVGGAKNAALPQDRIAFDWNRDAARIKRVNLLDLTSTEQIHAPAGSRPRESDRPRSALMAASLDQRHSNGFES